MQRKVDSGGILDFLSPCSVTCATQKSAKGGHSLEGDTTSTVDKMRSSEGPQVR